MSDYEVNGLDVSAWQDDNTTPKQIDFVKAKAAGAQFIIIKATQLTKDQDFDYNWRECKAAGIPRGAYCFGHWTSSAAIVSKNFVDALRGDSGEIYPTLDIENLYSSGYKVPLPPRANMLKWIMQFKDYVESELQRKMMIYLNPGMINYLKPIPDWMLAMPLWIAHWQRNYAGILYPKTPAIAPWEKWTFWQTSDKGDGLLYGMESKQVDIDWYNGTKYDFNNEFAQQPPIPPPYPQPLTYEQKVDLLWEAHPELHVNLL